MSDEMNNANATPPQQNAPILVFNDDAGNQINEISLAPGEQKKITVVLADHPEAITQNFLAQWSVYDSNHQLTNGITCVLDADSKKWLNPLCLSTTDESVGGMSGNDLNSARVSNGVWRCMGKNPNGQFWYPRDMYIPPVPVAEFVLMASSDWTDKYATVELDNNVTKFVLTTETGTPAANGTTVKCNYSMKLTVNNANADNVTPPQDNGATPTPPQDNNGVTPNPPLDNGGQDTPTPPQDNNGATPNPPQDNNNVPAPAPSFVVPAQPAGSKMPLLVFGDQNGNPINEISLAPGEEKKIQILLHSCSFKSLKAWQGEWVIYNSNHQQTSFDISCKKNQDEWMTPLNISTDNPSVGGQDGNASRSWEDEKQPGRWWYTNTPINRKLFNLWKIDNNTTLPIAIAEFTIKAQSNWCDQFATFEADKTNTVFIIPESGLLHIDYDMVLTIKNKNSINNHVTPPQPSDGGTTPPMPPQDNGGSTPVQPEPQWNYQIPPLVPEVSIVINQVGNASTLSKEAKFTYNTFCLGKDPNGNKVKLTGKQDVLHSVTIQQEEPVVFKLPLSQGEYLDGLVRLNLFWPQGRENKFISGYFDASSGRIDIVLKGTFERLGRSQNVTKYEIDKSSPSQFVSPSSQGTPVGNGGSNTDKYLPGKNVQVDILMNAWTIANEKNVEVQFSFNTCRYKQDANGNTVKVAGKTDVKEVKSYTYSTSHDVHYLPLEQGEHVDGNVSLIVFGRSNSLDKWEKHIIASIDVSSGTIGLIFTGSTGTDSNGVERVVQIDSRSTAKLINYEQKKPGYRLRYETDEERRRAIRDGLRNTSVDPKMVLYNDTLYNEDKAPEKSFVATAGECYILRNVNKPISETKYVRGRGYPDIYPGAIVFADKHLSEGSPIPLANVARSQTQIFGTFFSGKSTLKTVDATTAGDVHTKIGEMMRELFDSDYQPAKTFDHVTKIYSSKNDMMVSMGVDSSFCGCNLKVNATVNNNESSFIHDTSQDEHFFTVRVNDNYRDDISKLFGNDVTWEQIREYSTVNGHVQPLAIITSVTYGRSVHFLKEYSTKSFHYEGDQSFEGLGQTVTSKQDIVNSFEATTAQLISLGDAGAGSKILTDSGETEGSLKAMSYERICQVLEKTSKFGADNQGVPMTYTIELISGDTPGIPIIPTFDGNIVDSEYMRCPKSVQIFVRNNAYCTASEENVRISIGYMVFNLITGPDGKLMKNVLGHRTWQKTFRQDKKHDQSASLPLSLGEYLDMESYPTLTVESRGTDVGILSKKWKINIDNQPIDASSGVIHLTLEGNTLQKNVNIADDSKTKIVGTPNSKTSGTT